MDTARLEFVPYSGDLMGLAANENHVVFRWNVDFCTILLSMTRQGLSANCHFASNKTGLRYIKEAVDRFVWFVFSECEWCRMVVANVNRPSVGRMIERLRFFPIAKADGAIIYVRPRDGIYC